MLRKFILGASVFVTLLIAVVVATAAGGREAQSDAADREGPAPGADMDTPDDARTAVFAGGCFWCMEEAFEKVAGVVEAVSGYAGGSEDNPSYYEVASGATGHLEVVQVVYDPSIVSYEDLLNVFWRNVDLLDGGGQFCDRGNSYRTGIFYGTEQERIAAESSRTKIEESGRFDRSIATEIRALDKFWVAEDYHQDYYKIEPIRYTFYKSACGRERRLEQLWGDEAGGTVRMKAP